MPGYEHWKSKIHPFSEAILRLPFSATLTESEIELARAGLLPKSMDDKWVGFVLNEEIGFFRSWTGHQIYRLRLKRNGAIYEVGPLEVLNDATIYRRQDDAFDVEMVKRLLARLTRSVS